MSYTDKALGRILSWCGFLALCVFIEGSCASTREDHGVRDGVGAVRETLRGFYSEEVAP